MITWILELLGGLSNDSIKFPTLSFSVSSPLLLDFLLYKIFQSKKFLQDCPSHLFLIVHFLSNQFSPLILSGIIYTTFLSIRTFFRPQKVIKAAHSLRD